MSKFEQDFIRYINADFPIIYVDTLEDDKAKKIIHEICNKNQIGVIEWNMDEAWDFSVDPPISIPKADLASTLKLLVKDGNINDKILIVQDAHFSLDKPENIATLKSLAQRIIENEFTFNICIVSPLIPIPKELENYTTIMELETLDEESIKKIVLKFNDMSGTRPPEKDLLDKLVTRLKGLSQTEIHNILSLAMAEDGILTYFDLPLVLEQKQQAVKKSGILEMIHVKESMDDIGGLENLKTWLLRKAEIFKQIKKAQDFGVDTPKGVLIAGMPGCGKSLTAKAVAKAFDVPLLRLDMGRLMGKYVGESEANMRRAIKLTEASSPCVLWIDELEKAFAGVKSDGGGSEVTMRLFGNFLTWMQEKG